MEGEVWGTPGQPVVIVLRAHGTQKYWLARVQVDNPKMSAAQLAAYLTSQDFRQLGKVISLSK